MIEFLEELREIGNIPNVRRAITRRTDYGRLEFFNGSILEIIPGTVTNIRGKRCNQLIVSGVFDRELLSQMERIIVPYRSTESSAERFFNTALFGARSRHQTDWVLSKDNSVAESFEEASKELDAFLDSFTVNQNVNKSVVLYT
ncbi:MAG: hypothetical protein K2F81_07290 [Ruminococcus sp.]|nr:hypothetical protein [Ruminococcus sp.]